MEERILIQKSKLNWHRLGVENTNFFHCFLAAEKIKNLITELMTSNGSVEVTFQEIEQEILVFFSNYLRTVLAYVLFHRIFNGLMFLQPKIQIYRCQC